MHNYFIHLSKFIFAVLPLSPHPLLFNTNHHICYSIQFTKILWTPGNIINNIQQNISHIFSFKISTPPPSSFPDLSTLQNFSVIPPTNSNTSISMVLTQIINKIMKQQKIRVKNEMVRLIWPIRPKYLFNNRLTSFAEHYAIRLACQPCVCEGIFIWYAK